MNIASTTPISIVIVPNVWFEVEKNQAPAMIGRVTMMAIPPISLSTSAFTKLFEISVLSLLQVFSNPDIGV